MIDFYLLSVIVFFIIIFALIYKNRKTIEIKGYILFMKRTKRFGNIIDKIAKKSPRLWKILGTVGVIVCILFMIYGTFWLFDIAHKVSIGLITTPQLALVLPSPTATGYVGPGLILIPFWFWIIIIAAILIPHELAHGIIARAEKVKLKSVGLLLLAIFPGAFVEPDEKQLEKKKLLPQLRIFAAGSAANFLVAGIVLLLLVSVVWPGMTSPGLEIANITENGPAYNVGMRQGMIINEINNIEVSSHYMEYFLVSDYLLYEDLDVKPNQTVEFSANGELYYIDLSTVNKTQGIGIQIEPAFEADFSPDSPLLLLLTMLWSLSLAVGLVNILPLYPLDGGQMVNSILQRLFNKRKARRIITALSYAVLIIIIFDFVGPFLVSL